MSTVYYWHDDDRLIRKKSKGCTVNNAVFDVTTDEISAELPKYCHDVV